MLAEAAALIVFLRECLNDGQTAQILMDGGRDGAFTRPLVSRGAPDQPRESDAYDPDDWSQREVEQRQPPVHASHHESGYGEGQYVRDDFLLILHEEIAHCLHIRGQTADQVTGTGLWTGGARQRLQVCESAPERRSSCCARLEQTRVSGNIRPYFQEGR